LEKQIFCVHCGLSPELNHVDEVKAIKRFEDIPHEGPVCDILWNDPEDGIEGWHTSPKGAGYFFGKDITNSWLKKHEFSVIVRARSLEMEGFRWMHEGSVLSIFSAQNFLDRCGNLAAIVLVDEESNIKPVLLPVLQANEQSQQQQQQ